MCGRPYCAQGAKSGQFAYYICGTLFTEGAGTCTARYLNAPRVEDFVVEKIRERILTEETIVELVQLVAEEIDAMAGELSGTEAQGSRPALDSWRPATSWEASEYILRRSVTATWRQPRSGKGCVRRLAQLAQEEDKAGVTARTGLADALSPLILERFIGIDEVESLVRQVTAKTDYWPEAMRSLPSDP